MAINHYFQGGRGIGNNAEKRLHEDLIIEGLKKSTDKTYITYHEH